MDSRKDTTGGKQGFLDNSVQSGEKSFDCLLWVFGTGSQLLVTAAKMRQVGELAKDPKVRN